MISIRLCNSYTLVFLGLHWIREKQANTLFTFNSLLIRQRLTISAEPLYQILEVILKAYSHEL